MKYKSDMRGDNFTPDILRNHFYSWGSMFIGSQNFPGSLGPNFVGSVIGKILMNIKHKLVYRFVGMYIRK